MLFAQCCVMEALQVLLVKEDTAYKTFDYLWVPEAVEGGVADMEESCDFECDSSGKSQAGMIAHGSQESKKRKWMTKKLSEQVNDDASADTARPAVPAHHEEARRRRVWREKLCEWAFQGTSGSVMFAGFLLSTLLTGFLLYCLIELHSRRSLYSFP